MESYINLYSSGFRPMRHPFEDSKRLRGNIDIYDPENGFNDHGKWYVANWKIYSAIPYFDEEKWFEEMGIR